MSRNFKPEKMTLTSFTSKKLMAEIDFDLLSYLI